MGRLSSRVCLASVAIAAVLGITGAAPAAAREQALPQAQVAATCRVQAASLVVRSGPGGAFPVVAILNAGAAVRGVSFVRTGIPNGSWVEVELAAGTPIGFVAADAQSIRCQPAPNTLPAGKIPPAPTLTRQRVSREPVDGGDLSDDPVVRGPANVNNGQYIILPGTDQKQVDAVIQQNGGRIFFGDALGFGVEPLDRRTGQAIGNGIQEVRFQITYFDEDSGDELVAYQTVERNAPYCIFSDENGQCNVLRFSRMGYKWPDTQWARGAQRPAGNTQYTALITIVPRQGAPILWRWAFDMSQIAVEFP